MSSQRRAELARLRAAKKAEQEREEQKQRTIERALRQEDRAALRAAVRGYEDWTAKRDELRDSLNEGETTLAGLLASESSEIDLELLKKQTAEVADCRLLADALRARLSAWQAKEDAYVQPLRATITAAQGELSILHQTERERRMAKACEQLDAIVDLSQLHKIAQGWGGIRVDDLAALARQVIELDRVAGYSGRYRWQYSAHDSQLLTKAAELESFYTEVVPLVTRA